MTIFRSRLPLKPVPEESIWEYLFGGVSFDDARVVYKECNTRGRTIRCVSRARVTVCL